MPPVFTLTVGALLMWAGCVCCVTLIVQARGAARVLASAFGFGVGAVALLASWFMTAPFVEVHRLEALGETTRVARATVFFSHHEPPRAHFAFEVDGRTYTGSNDVGGALADLARADPTRLIGEIEVEDPDNEVRFMPDDPDTNRLDEARTYPSPLFWFLLGLFVLRVGSALVVTAGSIGVAWLGDLGVPR
jgi:hypothetical protein